MYAEYQVLVLWVD